jgi:hypothetical protein
LRNFDQNGVEIDEHFQLHSGKFSARAIGYPKFDIHFNYGTKEKINWVPKYKYLGYLISAKLGWGKFVKCMTTKVRQRISLIKSFKMYGCSSPYLRKTLFSSFVLPIFYLDTSDFSSSFRKTTE